jgi:hypothetical protein
MPRPFPVLALASALALTACSEEISRSVAAKVLAQKGQALCVSADPTNTRPLTAADKLDAGTILRTPADAEVDLMLIPGALARLSGDSELKIVHLELTKDGNETGDAMRDRRARLELRHGAMVVLFDGFGEFLIQAGDVTINVLPSCLLRVENDNERTRVAVMRGKLYAGTASNIVSVEAGAIREWRSGAAAPSAIEAGQINAAEIVQTARSLQDLAATRRDRLPF